MNNQCSKYYCVQIFFYFSDNLAGYKFLGLKYTLLYLKWITNKDLLYSTGNSACVWQPDWEGSLRENGHMYMYG